MTLAQYLYVQAPRSRMNEILSKSRLCRVRIWQRLSQTARRTDRPALLRHHCDLCLSVRGE